jgi:diguanylate cyclase (GGDEF)-like protein
MTAGPKGSSMSIPKMKSDSAHHTSSLAERKACATRLRRLARVDLDDREAAELWHCAESHRQRLREQLGRDIGRQVALLDYLLNIRPQIVAPTIIEAARLEMIEHDAISDRLTGLHNRQYFDRALERETDGRGPHRESAALLLLDLDGFKAVNDTEGHWVGDRVLEIVGHILRRHVRGGDVACRYGGDEFALLLRHTPVRRALVVAERIRADVASTFAGRSVGSRPIPLTVSIGVSPLPSGGTRSEPLIATADRALYQAKRSGANQISTIGEEAAFYSPQPSVA